ncbi:MAG TPA: phosphatase PAP2 family protein [Mycobacteriales bacterium]|nr:phosphatase PAP2 family protein [Mycobacteriales bacterium]
MPEATTDADPTWVCVSCRTRVPMALDSCPSCGWSIGAGLGASPGEPGTAEHARRFAQWAWLLREFLLLNVLFVLWRIVGHVSLFHRAGAFSRGRWLWHAERVLRLPDEASVQRPVLGHATWDRILNGYYAWAHIAVFAAALLWLMIRHRDVYPKWRNLVFAFTGVALVIGFLPVAPPRLIPSFGMVDLAARYHQSVYDGLGKGITDQLSAMPSVHVGWAVLVAGMVIGVLRTRWRWIALLYPAVTAYVIVVTANHYWLDGVGALLLLALVYFGMRRIRPSLIP